MQDNQVTNLKEQTTLRAELKNLHTLNQQMTEEARNLTRALKGDSKKQGAWGEIILEKVLERSGLRKGIEYHREVAIPGEDHNNVRPDAVVYLPEKKHIIIDAKVSLNAYRKSVDADSDQERNQHLKAHLLSVKNHIKSLSGKSYHLSDAFDSPEFTLMFMPVEPAFSAVLEYDNELFNDAWDKKIIMVSPTTLLATLRTVASLWKHERQTENAINIAREGGRLYDRIALFMQEFEKMEKPLDQAKASYVYLREKLTTNRQSLAGTALRLKELGVKTSKNMPGSVSGNISEEDAR
ncbi:MAG: DNA recombination protein RmuC [Bacteroidales bacterium]|nr:DNA recombination protein RmuC [Bacteroidales bacterium]